MRKRIARALDSKRRQAEEAEELSRLLIESDKNKDNQPEVPESHPSVEAIEVPLDVLNGIEDSLAKAKLNAGNK
ncbi:hypothetical protein AGMMS49953_08180 [Endomicrobiia bacterium]|uniref:hypothetical protein n=1 Tax=Endomicrobium trichonymphae TaxID=1408204 RepID=UPI000BBAF2C7|nr:hypothetical protein [Candidatus Endomicrobium trichonymphae]GHT24821.1 hypothetical protein AGMMS49953_08180 [Endomicrobiia bacterium]